jgi:hypothetical protein
MESVLNSAYMMDCLEQLINSATFVPRICRCKICYDNHRFVVTKINKVMKSYPVLLTVKSRELAARMCCFISRPRDLFHKLQTLFVFCFVHKKFVFSQITNKLTWVVEVFKAGKILFSIVSLWHSVVLRRANYFL